LEVGLGIASIRSTRRTSSDLCGTIDVPAWFGLTTPW
jgi:hypothetical protein